MAMTKKITIWYNFSALIEYKNFVCAGRGLAEKWADSQVGAVGHAALYANVQNVCVSLFHWSFN